MRDRALLRTQHQSERPAPADETVRAIVRLARDLPDIDADEARRRLDQLVSEQRGIIEETMRLTDEQHRLDDRPT
jgi:hypothetical protein